MDLELLKFQEDDFDSYYSLVSNESVMAQITERAIPYGTRSQSRFSKVLKTQ